VHKQLTMFFDDNNVDMWNDYFRRYVIPFVGVVVHCRAVPSMTSLTIKVFLTVIIFIVVMTS
jgi:hypothetical protein